MTSWATTDEPDIEVRLGTKAKRAKKRTGIQVTPNTFRVFGDDKLGDAYDTYEVTLEGRKYTCSCQTHAGGEFRKFCTHIAYVVLARRGRVEWAASPTPETVEDLTDQTAFQNLPDGPLPIFVDQGQEATDGARQAMDQHFGDSPTLPEWVNLIRDHQWDAYCEILYQLDAGKRVVFLSAPTGSGKTLIGEMVRRSFAKQTMYTCTTKTLQNQVEEDFPYAKIIKGRGNYRTLNFPSTNWLACDLCEQTKPMDPCKYCRKIDHCPYKVARQDAILSPIAVANVAYLLHEGNGQHTNFAGRSLVIIDEADALEEELMRYVEITLSPKLMKRLKIQPPDKKTVTDSWQEWVERVALPAIRLTRDRIHGSDPKDVRFKKQLNRLVGQLDGIQFDDDWVYTGYEQGFVTFKPVKVDASAPTSLWNLGKQFLLMSATIISAQQMAEDLGLEDDEWTVVDVPSTFPVENRPIYVEPVANMTAKTKETAWPKAITRLKEIADNHDERILVHTVSYALASEMAKTIGPRAITYRNATEREPALEQFRKSSNGILLAPSFERGIDLPYDQCRVVVVAKVPFPYLGDKQINKRLYSKGGRGWYSMQTIRSLVQMTGRAMRHADDSCEIYIIDAQFVENVWKKSKHLLPEWWKEAIYGYPRLKPSPNLTAIRGGRMK